MWKDERNGKWIYRERYIDPYTLKRKTVSVTLDGKATRKQAKLAEEILREKIEMILNEDRNIWTIKQVSKFYIEDQKRRYKEVTVRRTITSMNKLQEILGSDTLINKLDASFVRRRFNASGDSNTTLNERLKRLKAFMRWAYENDYVEDVNWLDKLKKYEDRRKKEKANEMYLEKEELQKLIESVEHPVWKNAMMFQVLSGMRVGEMLALEVDDVDLEEKKITINKTIDHATQKITDPKTYNSNREIYIQPELEMVCRKIMIDNQKNFLKTGNRSPFFIRGINDEHASYFAYNKWIRENSMRYIGREITTHVLRHTHVSLMAAGGVEPDTISRRCGHASSKITKEIYMHVTEEMIKHDNEQFKNTQMLG